MGIYRVKFEERHSGRIRGVFYEAPDPIVAEDICYDEEEVAGLIEVKRMDDLDDAPVQRLAALKHGTAFMVPGDETQRVLLRGEQTHMDAVTGEPVRLDLHTVVQLCGV